jgi:hypothetical protein
MEPNVDIEFREFAQIDEGDSGYPQDFDCRHPMPQFCAATDSLEKLLLGGELTKAADSGWDEKVSTPLAKSEKPHPDGIEIEKHGGQTWHWHWQGGELVKSMVEDPDLPGGVMHFDGDGNEVEIAA